MQPTPAEEIAAYWMLATIAIIFIGVMVIVAIACFVEWRKTIKRKKFRQRRDEVFGGRHESWESSDVRSREVIQRYPSELPRAGRSD